MFNPFAKFRDAAICLGFGLAGVLEQALVEQFLARVECLVGLLLARLAYRVIELLGKQRLGGLSFLNGLLHVVQKLLEILALLAQVAGDLLTIGSGGVAEAGILLLGRLRRVEVG